MTDNDHDILIRLDANVTHLDERLEKVEEVVKELNKTANLGKGALAILIGIGTAAGWIAHLIVDKFK